MSQPTEIAFQSPRRRDRAIQDEEWILEMLAHSPVGTLATTGPSGPSLNPNLFVLEPTTKTLYLHTAREGRTRRNVEVDPRVAFSVHEMGRILPASAAVDFSVEYASVVLSGHCKIVDDAREARTALDLLMSKYAPHLRPSRDYREISESDLARTTVLRIDIENWSAKGKAVDLAEAYRYEPDRVSAPKPRSTRTEGGFATALSSSFHQALWAGLRSRERKRS